MLLLRAWSNGQWELPSFLLTVSFYYFWFCSLCNRRKTVKYLHFLSQLSKSSDKTLGRDTVDLVKKYQELLSLQNFYLGYWPIEFMQTAFSWACKLLILRGKKNEIQSQLLVFHVDKTLADSKRTTCKSCNAKPKQPTEDFGRRRHMYTMRTHTHKTWNYSFAIYNAWPSKYIKRFIRSF